ncbi:sushi domain-containing protein 3 [Trichomycterus rosablanca]|uniref:sushi domain-containing protein 3 n=1 Tax=Trichomycterus rosablanca TaxID=2290929 RepID=UPI002F35C1F7
MASFNASVSNQHKVPPEEGNRTGNQNGQCTPMPSPALGTLKLMAGNGTAVGTVMILMCPGKHRAIRGGRVICVQDSNSTQWSGGVPECKPLSRHEDHGLRTAVLAALISSAIILLMSMFFITSCLLKRVKKEERRKLERKRRREAEELWKQTNAEEQRESFYNYNGRHNTNNNNSSRLGQQKSYSLTQSVTSIKSLTYSDLQSAYRHQQNHPDSTSIHYSQRLNAPYINMNTTSASYPHNTHFHCSDHDPILDQISWNPVILATVGQEDQDSGVSGQRLNGTQT